MVGPDIVVPERQERLDLLGMLGGQIMALAQIGGEVEQLPFLRAVGFVLPEQLPVALPDGAVAENLPRQVVLFGTRRLCFTRQRLDPRLTDQRRRLLTVDRLGITGAGHFEQRGHDVRHVQDALVVDAALGLLHDRTADDEGVADAALGQVALVLAERSHRNLRPHRAVADVGVRITPGVEMRLRPGERSEQEIARAGRAHNRLEEVGSFRAVVPEHDEDRVVVFADLLEIINQPPAMVVHILHHAGVELHLFATDGSCRGRQGSGIGQKPHAFG